MHWKPSVWLGLIFLVLYVAAIVVACNIDFARTNECKTACYERGYIDYDLQKGKRCTCYYPACGDGPLAIVAYE